MDVKRLEVGDEALARDAIVTLKIVDSNLRDDLTSAYLRSFLARPENYLIVATEDGESIGYVVAYLLDRVDRDRHMMLLYEISVEESHHRRGVGSAMINLLKTFCRQRGVMKMWVYTNKSNAAAMRLYESTGAVADESGDEIGFEYWPESFEE